MDQLTPLIVLLSIDVMESNTINVVTIAYRVIDGIVDYIHNFAIVD